MHDARPGPDRFGYRHRSLQDKQRSVKISADDHSRGRFDSQDFRRANHGCRRGGSSPADDQAEIRTTPRRNGAMGLPVSLEPRAAARRVEEAVAVAPESQLQAASGDQNQRTAVTRVRRELAVPIDVGEAQTPGKVLTEGRLPGDLEGEPSPVAPGHLAIGFVFPDLTSRLSLQVPAHIRSRTTRPSLPRGYNRSMFRSKSGR